jgi:hypothetical protein
LLLEMLDLLADGAALVSVHIRGQPSRQPAPGALYEGGGDVQIAPQASGPGRGGGWLSGRLGFKKQLGLVEKAVAGQGRAVTPSGIQLPGLSRAAVMLSEHGGHPLAVVQAEARDGHQKLHGHVGGELACAHLLLEDLG